MKVIKRIFTIIITIILVSIFTYNVYNLINIKILKNDMTPVFGYTMLEVVSGSMEPTIHVGDIIIIDMITKEYKENDIVTFRDDDNALITHRIISIDENEVVTKGDNNNTADPVNTRDKIVGKYVTKVNGLGRLITAFKSPVTIILIFVIGILTCVLVSTDKDGNPIIDEDEEEFQEYLKMKNNNKKASKKAKKKDSKKNTKKNNNKKEKSNNTKSKKNDNKKKSTKDAKSREGDKVVKKKKSSKKK